MLRFGYKSKVVSKWGMIPGELMEPPMGELVGSHV